MTIRAMVEAGSYFGGKKSPLGRTRTDAMRLMSTTNQLFAGVLASFVIAVLPALAQTFPNRPIRVIVNFPPGGTGDIVARLIGGKLSIALGQSVFVENRPGAGGTVGARSVVNAPPDGYTLTVAQTPEIAINPYFMKGVDYDPLGDLAPIALGGEVPLVLAVPADGPYSTIGDFATFLRTTDQPVTFASGGVGTSGHLAGELLGLKFNRKLTHVPYKGAGEALTDLVAGRVDFYFPGLIAALPFMKADKLKILAVATTKRSPAVPSIPTVTEATGIANFNFTLWAGFFAPHGTPADVTAQLNGEINKIILEPGMNAQLQANGVDVTAMSIDQFTAFTRGEIERYQTIIKEANLKPE
jgi:tripartite-type tricarboxylate transporter receptor subunit TctC